MKRTIQDKGIAAVADLRATCIEGGVKLIACQMTVDLLGFESRLSEALIGETAPPGLTRM